jgi:F-type H+-transporting ATPase subunit a
LTLTFAAKLGYIMMIFRLKTLLIGAFSVFCLLSSSSLLAQHHNENAAPHAENGHPAEDSKKFNANEVIIGHVLNGHEFHFMDIKGENGEKKPISIPLPIIVYEKGKGFTSFMSSKFEHGHANYKGYTILTEHKIAEQGLDPKKYFVGTIMAVDEATGKVKTDVKVLDISLTRNVVQMLIALTLLVWLMLSVAKKYKNGIGVTTAPKGNQSFVEPMITFIRDEVAIPNVGKKYPKYLPYFLTIFFFILINNIFGLVPGTANVTGNIAFTVIMGVISWIVILASTNKHYWGHIFNPPGVPFGVKLILVPVEVLGIFIKPIALIIRLFANMIAGHIIIICLISLIFIFGGLSQAAGWGSTVLSIGFTVFIYFIEVLVAFLQAYIFTNLTAVFIGQAMEGAHDEHHETAAAH